ncbi:MAG: nucleoside triphosphate pyrophosphohydrolase [Gemmatimonadales bacterium]|nr:MAG: nucleoside triphosphate pyrophosphohydrolase [Gemmatimonadales bacterium]
MERKRPDRGTAHPSPPVDDPGTCPPPSSDERTPDGFPPSPGHLDRALDVVTFLRTHCDWDRRQTAQSLVPHLLEEASETAEAVRSGDVGQVRDELGDLLLNVAFQIIVAEEGGHFSREDVIRSLEEKMIRRHPHLFGLGDAEDWDTLKARERAAPPEPRGPDAPLTAGGAAPSDRSVLDSLPTASGPLHRAHALQARASEVGFDWADASGALEKTREEIAEVAEALVSESPAAIHEEIGDLLFSVVNLARLAQSHAPAALISANEKFATRFRAVEALAASRGLAMPGTSLEQLDELWDEVKRSEAREAGHRPTDTP